MYLFIMYCICNRKLKKKKGERETICAKSSPWRTWDCCGQTANTLWPFPGSHLLLQRVMGAFVVCGYQTRGYFMGSDSALPRCCEWTELHEHSHEWMGSGGVPGIAWSPSLFQWEMIIASPEIAVTYSLENLPLSFINLVIEGVTLISSQVVSGLVKIFSEYFFPMRIRFVFVHHEIII